MRNKVALIVGLVLSVIVILGLVVLPIVFAIYGKRELIFYFLTIGLRLWTFLIGVGTLQEVMLLENGKKNIELRPDC